jgi:hypothetical protein
MSSAYWEGVALVEKVAMNRPMRELYKRLSEQYPEYAKSFQGPNRNINAFVPGHEGQNAFSNALLGTAEIEKSLGPAWARIFHDNSPPARLTIPHHAYRDVLRTRSSSTLQQATARQALDRRFSGAHAPKPGESFVPSAGNAEFIRKNSDAPGDILYRGNPVDVASEKELFYMSRHPEVAAGYASGDAALGGYSPHTNRMFAYRKSDFKQDPVLGSPIPEASADWQGIGPQEYINARAEDLNQLRTNRISDPTGEYSRQWFADGKLVNRPETPLQDGKWHPRTRSDVIAGRRHPTYETMVTPSMIPEPVAEYTVRRARDGDQVGYAMKPVTQK